MTVQAFAMPARAKRGKGPRTKRQARLLRARKQALRLLEGSGAW